MLDHEPGIFELALVGSLPNGIEAVQPFSVVVKQCEADIISVDAQLSLADQMRLWGSDPYLYEILNTLDAYEQKPACGYEMSHRIKYENLITDPGVKHSEAPVEVVYDPSTYTFNIEKCSDAQKPFEDHSDIECQMIPFEKAFQVYIETELVGEPRGEINDQVSFKVIIGQVCTSDIISWYDQSLIPDLDYIIRTPGLNYFTEMTIVQEHTECPASCKLTLANGGVIPEEFAITNPGVKPFLEIDTSDKLLNGASIDLKFTCVSPLSETGVDGSPSTISHPFTVRYKDECYSSNVFEPLAEDQTFQLYEPGKISFTVPYSSLSCNDVVTSIAVVTPDDSLTPEFTLDQEKGLIYFDPMYREQARDYTVVLQSCIYVYDDPRDDPDTYTEVCSPPSQPFQVKVEDPCKNTGIISDIFERSLALPQLQKMTVPLLAEMPEYTWPWKT